MVTPEELAVAKATWTKVRDTQLADDHWVVRVLANQRRRGRTTEFDKQLRARIAAVTVADVARVARAASRSIASSL